MPMDTVRDRTNAVKFALRTEDGPPPALQEANEMLSY